MRVRWGPSVVCFCSTVVVVGLLKSMMWLIVIGWSTVLATSLISFCYTIVQLLWNCWLEVKPCGFGSRMQDVETFWYKTEIKIVYFVTLGLIVLILWFTLTLAINICQILMRSFLIIVLLYTIKWQAVLFNFELFGLKVTASNFNFVNSLKMLGVLLSKTVYC